MKISRRTLIGTAAAYFAAAGSGVRAQSDWPSRVIRMVSPYGAGGPSDISLRMIADYLADTLKTQLIVENKPGAGTRLATESVTRAEPDGYTFLYAAAPYATAEALFGKLNYQRKDLQPVAQAVMAPLFLVVNADKGFKNAKDLIAYGKSKPEGLTFASPASGSQPHLAAELLFMDAGVKGLNVPQRGDAMAYTELLAGRVDATLTAITAGLPHIRAGKLRVLGAAAAERSPLYPEAPTLKEQGLERVIASGWYGFMAPAAVPKPIVQRMEKEIMAALGDKTIKDKLLAAGLESRPGTGATFAKFIDEETAKWSEVIKATGLKGE